MSIWQKVGEHLGECKGLWEISDEIVTERVKFARCEAAIARMEANTHAEESGEWAQDEETVYLIEDAPWEVALGAFMDVYQVYSAGEPFRDPGVEHPDGTWYQWVTHREIGEHGLVTYQVDEECGTLLDATLFVEAR